MCRIAGIINQSLSTGSLNEIVKEMCNILKHGGPDDEGFYFSDKHHLALGHRRLSLIDLSTGGHQPMSYADDRYVISYNGEIYNYIELRNELINEGYSFKTKSDTEVILASFTAWGINCFSKLNGMFAFALWDNLANDLYLVRDPIGIKPLYYAVTKEGLAFASEIKAFKPISYLQEKNDQWQVYMMAYGHLPEPVTTLQHVKYLPKGTFLQYHVATSTYELEVFKQYTYIEKISSREEAIGLVKDNFQKAVKRHMIADAPIGVFLSGGVDSSLLALLASNNGQSDLTTISLFFDDANYSEKKYQDIVKQKLTGLQYQHCLDKEEFDNYFPSIINMMDQPSCDGINTWFISKYAKESNLKAVLSGIGADELLGGYPSFERMKYTLLLQQLPDKLLNSAQYAQSKKLKRLSYLTIPGAVGRYLFLRGQFVPGEIAKHLGTSEKEIFSILQDEPTLSNIDYLTDHNQASWIEMNLYMRNQLLRDADVMSMAHGVELRVPFLDNDFVNLLLHIKSSVKYSGTNSKQLLIDSFKDILPEAIWNRPKMGFSFPFKEWLTSNNYVKDKMIAGERKNAESYQQFISGKMHWSQLVTLLLLSK